MIRDSTRGGGYVICVKYTKAVMITKKATFFTLVFLEYKICHQINDFYLVIREMDSVSQYSVVVREIGGETNFFVREEWPFKSISSLLSFYKRNMFYTTSLKRPVSSERVILRRSTKEVWTKMSN